MDCAHPQQSALEPYETTRTENRRVKDRRSGNSDSEMVVANMNGQLLKGTMCAWDYRQKEFCAAEHCVVAILLFGYSLPLGGERTLCVVERRSLRTTWTFVTWSVIWMKTEWTWE